MNTKNKVLIFLCIVLAASLSVNVLQFYKRDPIRKVIRKIRPKRSAVKTGKTETPKKKTENLYLDSASVSRYNPLCLSLDFNTSEEVFLPEDRSSIKLTPAVKVLGMRSNDEGNWFIDAAFKPDTVYTIRLPKGITSADGKVMKENESVEFRTPLPFPEIRFLTSGMVLPLSRKKQEIPLRLTSVRKIEMELRRYYDNHFSAPSIHSIYQTTQKVAELSCEIPSVKQEMFDYALDLSKLIPEGTPGAYELILRAKDCSSVSTTIVISDLGIQAVCDSAHKQLSGAVRTLSSGSAVAGASAELYSCKNQLLASGRTSPEGIISLDYSATLTDEEDYPKYLAVRKGNDCSRLDLTECENDLSHFAMNGNVFSARPKAFVFAERGVCRPGESLHVFAVLRNEDLSPLKKAPCVWELKDPKGQVIRKLQTTADAQGFTKTVLEFPEELPTGRYTFSVRSGSTEPAGASSVLVAQYVPDRIKVTLKNTKQVLTPGMPDVFQLTGDYYFGQDAGSLPYQFSLAKSRSFQPYPGWNVGDDSVAPELSFRSKGTLSGGKAAVKYPGCKFMAAPLHLCFEGSVTEPGGRAVTARVVTEYHPSPWYLALRKNEKSAASGDFPLEWGFFPAEKGKIVSMSAEQEVTLHITRLEWKYNLKDENNHCSYQWERVRHALPDRKVTFKGFSGTEILPLAEGEYELIAEYGKLRTRLVFCHWRGEGGARSRNPSVLSFTTDKEKYSPGEKVSFTFQSPIRGSAVVSVGENRLNAMYCFPVKKGKNTLSLTLPSGLKTGSCFIGVTVAGPESRRFGVLRLNVDQEKHHLDIKVQVPEKARSAEKIPLKLTVTGKDGLPVSGIAQIFAVDEGILALTAYRTPDPFSFFRGTFRCPFSYSDLYGTIYPLLKISRDGRIGGGDLSQTPGFAAMMRGKVSGELKRFAPAIVVLDTLNVKDGVCSTVLALPEHTGAMRLMAVVLAGEKSGSAEKTVLLHDALSVLPSAPRTLVQGDTFEAVFTLFNHDVSDPNGTFLWNAGSRKGTEKITLQKGKSVTKRILLQAEKQTSMEISFELRMKGASGKGTLHIPVRPAVLPQRTVQNILLKPGDSWNSAELSARNGEHFLCLQSGVADLSCALNFLNQYPYGCLEQTVSTAFPYLACQNLVKAGVIRKETASSAKRKIRETSEKLLSMLLPGGAFAGWPDSSKAWNQASVFAAHYLLEAKGKLPPSVLRFLGAFANDGSVARFDRAYACYVLAAAGNNRFPVPARAILAEGKQDFAALLAAGAMVRGGYAGEGIPLFRKACGNEVWRENAHPYAGSSAMAGMTLYLFQDLLSETEALNLAVYLAKNIRHDGTWGTTHANAWAVLGLSAFTAAHGGKAGFAEISRNGKVTAQKTGEILRMKYEKGMTVTNRSKGNVLLTVTSYGIPEKIAESSGPLLIQREYLNADGKKVTSAKQGELLTVRLTLQSPGKVPDLVLADLLPGGLEIEDGALATRASSVSKKSDCGKLVTGHTEKRDDRFLFFGTMPEKGTGICTYQVRAVSRGKYVLPAVHGEAMYDPSLCGSFVPSGFFEVK